MVRGVLSHSRLWRQGTGSLTVKSLNRFDDSVPIAVLLSPPPTLPTSAYKTSRRSAYSVLRSRNTPPTACAQNLLSSPDTTATTGIKSCCCAALLYHVAEQSGPTAEKPDRERDDFVFALKLASEEQSLRDLLGEERYAMLVGPALTQAQQVGLCQDLPQLGEGGGTWVARMLLTPEEDNRVKWLFEDETPTSATFARVPSFKAMYVAYHAGREERLDLRQFEAIEDRMRENRIEWDMSDAAVACSFSMKHEKLRPYLCHVVQHTLLGNGEPSAETNAVKKPVATLRHVLGGMLLLQCLRQLKREAQEADGHTAHPPTYLFAAVTQLLELAAALPSDEVADVVGILAKLCRESALSFADSCVVPTESLQLPDFTLWLLKEAPDTAACHHHFRRMVLRSQAEALALLEKSGLLLTRSIDLRVVVTLLLPLLDGSGHEEFFFLVIREVLTGLEESLRRDVHCFTAEDMRLIAVLGTRLFEVQQQGDSFVHHSSGSFDATARGQLEELQVMDGSPWALVALSYNYLKEIVRALARDHRKLQEQVQAQMRNIVEAVTADVPGGNEGQPLPPPRADKKDDSFKKAPMTSNFDKKKEGEEKKDEAKEGNAATPTTAPLNSSSINDSNIDTGGRSRASSSSSGQGASRLRLSTPPSLRERFVVFIEELVKALVDETGTQHQKGRVVSKELFDFVNYHVPIPNIHDEYRRKIFLLVNVVSEKSPATNKGTNKDNNENGGGAAIDPNDEIPAELRLLVTSLPLTLSPWAGVMILREVLSESAGNNPRYMYVLNAAIDLQLPISTTRSRIATTLNMWQFLSSQADKLTVKEQLAMKQRCVFNLPLSYVMSSYWSLLTWLSLLAIIGLNVVGLDFESQYVATRLFEEFGPPDDVLAPAPDLWNKDGAEELTSIYLENPELSSSSTHHPKRHRSSSELLLSSASYLFLGTDDQRRPMTVIPIRSDESLTATERAAEEYSCASAVLRELSLQLHFPFYLSIEQQLPVELIIARVAERIRRVSFDNAWFVSRVIFRTFPLGRYHTEYGLVAHTCAQANLTRRRMTFLLYFHQGAPLPPQLFVRLRSSVLAQNGNLVVVAHEESLQKGGTTADTFRELGESGAVRCIPYSKQWAMSAEGSTEVTTKFGPELPTAVEKFRVFAAKIWGDVAAKACWIGQKHCEHLSGRRGMSEVFSSKAPAGASAAAAIPLDWIAAQSEMAGGDPFRRFL